MAIFHYTIKIVGRSKGKSVISASAYLNGDVMKNEETGRISYYTSKKEVVYTSLMMCENAPPEWQIVPEENIKRFQKSVRYKRSEDKEAALKQGCKRKSALRWNGTDSDLIELVAALMAAGSVDCAEGKKLTIVDVIRVFEDAFNIKINALYTKRGKVFDRCTDSTPFIDSLRKSYIRMLDERLA